MVIGFHVLNQGLSDPRVWCICGQEPKYSASGWASLSLPGPGETSRGGVEGNYLNLDATLRRKRRYGHVALVKDPFG